MITLTSPGFECIGCGSSGVPAWFMHFLASSVSHGDATPLFLPTLTVYLSWGYLYWFYRRMVFGHVFLGRLCCRFLRRFFLLPGAGLPRWWFSTLLLFFALVLGLFLLFKKILALLLVFLGYT